MRYTGHLDMILTWERTFRRSGLPLSYSKGYSPRPVINLAAPLPLGYLSRGEIGDFWLSEQVSSKTLESSLSKSLPPGLDINNVEEIPEIHGDKLPSLVEAAQYRIVFETKPGIGDTIALLLEKSALPRERKGKTYDLRPQVLSLELLESELPGKSLLFTTMTLLPGAAGRPDELLRELNLPVYQSLICREKIFLKKASD